MKINEKTKKFISSLVIATTITTSLPNLVLAKSESANNKEIKVYFNDEQISFDQQPVIVDGRTKVPFRAIFETMGTVVYYRESDKSILGLSRDGDVIQHTIGTNKATINGIEKTYDSISEMMNGRTLIPVRMVSDLLNAEVEWKEKSKEVLIEKEITTNEYHQKIRGILECTLNNNFNPEDFKRYLDYQYKHWNMEPKQVILDVNMDLDRELVERIITYPIKNSSYNSKKELWGLAAEEEDIEIVTNTEDNLIVVNKFNSLPYGYIPSNMYNINANYTEDESYRLNLPLSPVQLKEEAYLAYLKLNADYKSDTNEKYGLFSIRAFMDKYSLDVETWALENMTNTRFKEGTKQERLNYVYRNTLDDLQTGLSFLFETTRPTDEAETTRYKQILGYELSEYENSNLRFYHYSDDECNWLKENSYKYGFIQRYPSGKEHITRMLEQRGLYRYVGVEVAKIIHDNNWCLEEYCARYTNTSEYKTDLNSTKQKVLNLK